MWPHRAHVCITEHHSNFCPACYNQRYVASPVNTHTHTHTPIGPAAKHTGNSTPAGRAGGLPAGVNLVAGSWSEASQHFSCPFFMTAHSVTTPGCVTGRGRCGRERHHGLLKSTRNTPPPSFEWEQNAKQWPCRDIPPLECATGKRMKQRARTTSRH